MGHHYVPVRYLSGFTRGDRLWVFEKPSGRVFKSQPDAIANERELYTNELEGRLNTTIEQPANFVLAKIGKREPLDQRDRESLAVYVVSMWKRGRVGRTRVMDLVPETVDEITNNLEGDLHELKGRLALSNDRYFNLLSQTGHAREKLKANPPPETWWDFLDPSKSREVVDVLLQMNWAFLTDPRGEVLTSDNPVYFFPWAGIGRPESELVFPIDRHTAMLATHERFATCTYFLGKGVALREINRRTVGNADRHVIAAERLDWPSKVILNGGGPSKRLRVLG